MKIAGCLFMILVMLMYPDKAVEASHAALSVWALDVVPSLFPYMVFCRMLSVRMQKSPLSPAPVAACLGLMGGSPSGAASIAAYAESGRLTRSQLLPLCALTGTISPMFVLNTAGSWLGGASIGRRLLLTQLLSAALATAIVRQALSPASGCAAPKQPSSCGAMDPIVQSVSAMLGVGGCIVFYSVLAAGIQSILPLPPVLGALLHSAFEAAGGVHALSLCGLPACPAAILSAAACGFSGLSILSQNLLFVRPFGVNMKHLIAIGLLRAALCALLMALLCYLP